MRFYLFTGVKLSNFINDHDIVYNVKTLRKNFDLLHLFAFAMQKRQLLNHLKPPTLSAFEMVKGVIDRRNTCIHPQNLEELKEHVENCEKYIENYPQLREKYKYEIFTIEHYSDFVKSAPL